MADLNGFTGACLDTIVNALGGREALDRILGAMSQEEVDRAIQLVWEEIAE